MRSHENSTIDVVELGAEVSTEVVVGMLIGSALGGAVGIVATYYGIYPYLSNTIGPWVAILLSPLAAVPVASLGANGGTMIGAAIGAIGGSIARTWHGHGFFREKQLSHETSSEKHSNEYRHLLLINA